MVDTEARGKQRLRLTVDMEDTEDIVADMVDTVVDMVDTEARGKLKLRLTVDMEDTEDIVVDMAATDMEADITDKH